MPSLNWDRMAKQAAKKEVIEQLKNHRYKRRLKTVPASLQALFDAAIKRTSGSDHYRVVLSMQRQFLLKGWLSSKQGDYLRSLAGSPPSGRRGVTRTSPVAGPGPAPGPGGLLPARPKETK